MNIHDLYEQFMFYFRRRRMRAFEQAFALGRETRVLDIGGTAFNWRFIGARPRLILLNVDAGERTGQDPDWVLADARYLPFASHAFDIVYSNSVIEHLGTWESQQQMAKECGRVGRRYYVQTPNRYFPIEPHLLTPFIHWLPRSLQRRLIRHFTLWGWVARPSRDYCERFLEQTRLLSEGDLMQLLPDAQIWKERFMGMAKSLIAVRRDN